MAKYRVLEKSYLNGRIHEEGDVVEYDGEPGSNLEAIAEEGAGKKAGKGSKKPEAPAPAGEGQGEGTGDGEGAGSEQLA